MSEMRRPGSAPGIGQTFDETLVLLDALSRAMDHLDAQVLTGRPHSIAEAAVMLEAELAICHAGFDRFCMALKATGEGRLGTVAQRLRQSPEPALGIQLDRIGRRLLSLARRSGAGLRRAEALSAGLSASLQALRAVDAVGRDQLLAEA